MTREQAQKIARSANQEAFAPSLERRVQVRYRRSVAGDGALCAVRGQDVWACVDSDGRYHDLTPRQLRECTYADSDGKPIASPAIAELLSQGRDVAPRRAVCGQCDEGRPVEVAGLCKQCHDAARALGFSDTEIEARAPARPACKFCDGSEPCGWCDKAPLAR